MEELNVKESDALDLLSGVIDMEVCLIQSPYMLVIVVTVQPSCLGRDESFTMQKNLNVEHTRLLVLHSQ